MRLSRNRDFVLFQAGQLLSATGSSLSAIAYPLVVLSLTHSPAKAGVVSFARLLPAPVLAPAAGVAADRFDRRRIMLASDVGRAAALAALALLLWRHAAFWSTPLLAFGEGVGDAFFGACVAGVLRSVVPSEQLPDAVSVQTGRTAVVGVAGPPAGGALFAVAHPLPFAVDAASYACSFAALAAIRTPFQQPRERSQLRVRAELAEGFRFLWTQRFLRATSFFYAVGNVTIPALLFVVVVVARRHGLSGGQIGLLLALSSACLLIGSLAAGATRRRLSLRAVVLVEAYTGLLGVAFVVDPSVFVLVAAILPQAFVLPITDSYVVAHRIAATPDRLLGRVEAARLTIARAAAPVGSLLAGVLLTWKSSRAAVGVFLGLNLLAALYAGAAKPLRSPPPLEQPA